MDVYKRMTRRMFVKGAGTVVGVTLTLPALSGLLPAYDLDAGEGNDPSPQLMNRLVNYSKEKKIDYGDVFYEHSVYRQISMENETVKSIDYSIDKGLGVRVVRKQAQGYAYTQSLKQDDLFSTVDRASQILDKKANAQPVRLKLQPDRGIIPIKQDLNDLTLDKRIEQMRIAADAAKKVSDLVIYRKIDYIEHLRRIMVANTEGTLVADYQPNVFFIVYALAFKDGKRHMGRRRVSYNSGYEMFARGFPRTAGHEAATEALTMLEAKNAPAGQMPVVIANGWGGVIVHEAVGHGCEADAVAKGSSFYEGMRGKQVASETVNMADSGNIKGLRGSYNYDDEGSPSQETVIIRRGKLVNYMTDIRTAKELDLKRTGNSRRESFRHPPLVRMTNTFLMGGTYAPEDIIADTAKGIYAVKFGGGTVDTVTGNFTFTVREGYLIENGKISGPVTGASLIGRGPETLKKVDAVAWDLDWAPGICGKGQWVPVTVGQPTIRVSEMTVGGVK